MSKVLKIAYLAGGASHTLGPFYSIIESKHKLTIVCTKKNQFSGRSKKKLITYY